MTESSISVSDSYLRQITYPEHVHREVMPLCLVSAMTAVGQQAPDLSRPYVYVDLGCGTGLSTMVAASCNPMGHFIGVDFNAEQIAQAKNVAQALGLRNIEFRHSDFMHMAKDASAALPECDFMVLHGVYSWVAEPVQKAIRQLVERYLCPGGLFYLSYISQPGAASFSSAQRFFRMAAQQEHPAPITEQVHAGIRHLSELARGGAGYFVEHASALREVEQLAHMSSAYLAHEFLNEHWQALHSSDVIGQMNSIGCDYVGSANLLENVDAFSLPAKLAESFTRWQQAGWPIESLETARDLARNQNQRRDIYQKQAAAFTFSSDQHRKALLSQRMSLSLSAPYAQMLQQAQALQLPTRIGTVHVEAALVLPLLMHLQSGECSYAELAALPAYRAQPGLINQLLQALVHMSYVHFLRPDSQMQADSVLNQLDGVLAKAHNDERLFQRLTPASRAGMAVAVSYPPIGMETQHLRRCKTLGLCTV